MMTNILFWSTIVLDFAGFLFSGIFLWNNLSTGFSDIADRNATVLRITKASMIVSIVFGLLTCLLSDAGSVEVAIEKSALLFSIIAITWLAVLVACGIAMLFTVISKTHYRSTVSKATKKLFAIALPGSIICLVLTWIFS